VRGLNRYSILVVGLFVLGFSPSAEASCKAVARNLGALIQRAEEKIDFLRRRGELREATFYRFEEDQLAAQTWGGVIPPRGLFDLLPEGITLIDHSLLGATEAGVVKDAGSGEFMSLRLTADGMGTNIGLGRTAILQNASRTQKSLVRENAKAVILFMHGGGTRTTGHHVAINLMNHFSSLGVDVISFDQPWHGEGPRKNFSSPKEYFDWMRKWVRDYVAVSGKPIFLAGHSMGGEFADTYMRLYPKDDLVAGVVALSSVIDPQPGSSLREKLKRMEERDEAARSDTSETPEDRLLLHSLVTQNKLSFTALLFESLFSTQTSWVIPPHGGRDYIPALYVWGAKDWL